MNKEMKDKKEKTRRSQLAAWHEHRATGSPGELNTNLGGRVAGEAG